MQWVMKKFGHVLSRWAENSQPGLPRYSRAAGPLRGAAAMIMMRVPAGSPSTGQAERLCQSAAHRVRRMLHGAATPMLVTKFRPHACPGLASIILCKQRRVFVAKVLIDSLAAGCRRQ